MKKSITTIVCILILHLSSAQVKDYFIPSNEYIGKAFLFEAKWTNEKGEEFQSKNNVSYFLDPSGNYKKYSVEQEYRFNVPFGPELRTHKFFNISNGSVAEIYSYTEGLSEELKDLGLIKGNEIHEVILKSAPANWEDKTDKDVTDFYKSSTGKLITAYASYDDCLIVNVTSKSRTGKAKWAEKGMRKYYYAYSLGLVRQELYFEGKLVDVGTAGGTMTLVDNFSKYSFVERRKKEGERLQAELKQKQEEKELEVFLKERSEKIYSYSDIEPDKFNELKRRVNDDIYKEVTAYEKSNLDFNFDIKLSVDLNGKTTLNTNYAKSNSKDFEEIINSIVGRLILRPAIIKNYPVNATCELSISFSKSKELYTIKYDGRKIISGAPETTDEVIATELSSHSSPAGTYVIEYSGIKFNDKGTALIKPINYKSLGGGSFGLLSLIIPGSGDHFVKINGGMLGKKVSPWITTISSLGLVGAGVYLKSSSDKNYELYHKSTTQTDIDKYYDLANDQNKMAFTALGAGAIIWVSDIIWVTVQGNRNTKESNAFKRKTGLALKPTLLNNKDIGMSFTLKF